MTREASDHTALDTGALVESQRLEGSKVWRKSRKGQRTKQGTVEIQELGRRHGAQAGRQHVVWDLGCEREGVELWEVTLFQHCCQHWYRLLSTLRQAGHPKGCQIRAQLQEQELRDHVRPLQHNPCQLGVNALGPLKKVGCIDVSYIVNVQGLYVSRSFPERSKVIQSHLQTAKTHCCAG
jgi:hypothetical protein